jgi:hypothetical protein
MTTGVRDEPWKKLVPAFDRFAVAGDQGSVAFCRPKVLETPSLVPRWLVRVSIVFTALHCVCPSFFWPVCSLNFFFSTFVLVQWVFSQS